MMYLSLSTPKISIYTIMMIGSWSSIAFMEFSKGVSKSMIQNNTFYNSPDTTLD